MPKDVIKERLMIPEQSKSYPLRRAIENNHYNGVLKEIFKKDQFNLIQLKDHEQKNALNRCWDSKNGKVALLILQNISSMHDRIKLIEYTGTENTSLQYALQSGDLELVLFIFQQLDGNQKLKSKLLKYKDSKLQNNFHYAAKGGNVDCIKLLISKCENDKQRKHLFAEDNGSRAPAFVAIMDGKVNAADFFLKQMDQDQKTKFYNTRVDNKDPIKYLRDNGEESKEHIETLKVLVSHLKDDDDHLYTTWLFAAKMDDIEMGKLILSKASDEQVKNKIINFKAPHYSDLFNNAMHECCTKNTTKFLEWLLSIISDDNGLITGKNYYTKTPLMIASENCHAKCCKLILDKIKNNKKIKNELLKHKDAYQERDAIGFVLNSSHKKKEALAKLILNAYDETDFESTFLPCVQLGDIKMLKRIWDKTKNDKELQKKLLSTTDKQKNNCFLLVCTYGKYESLNWLLSLNDDEKDGDLEDEKNLTQKHADNGNTPLLLCVANDKRTKPKGDEKVLTDEQKENYFKCVQLIFSKVTNKMDLILDTESTKQKDALMFCCSLANLQTATFLLGQVNDKYKKKLCDRKSKQGGGEDFEKNHFHHAVKGGNLELVKMIYEKMYKKYGKHKQIINDSNSLNIALREGYDDIVQYLLFSLIRDSKTKVQFLNQHINSAKTERKFTKNIKNWLTTILSQTKIIEDVQDIMNLFKWLLNNSESDSLAGITMILSKMPYDSVSKDLLIKTTKCISYACKNNRINMLRKLLAFLDSYTKPLFESNAFIESIESNNGQCVDIIFKSIKNKKDKERLIEESIQDPNDAEKHTNALLKAIKIKSKDIIDLIFTNHSNIDCMLGDAFLFCIDTENIESANMLLNKSKNSSTILNYKSNKTGNTCIMMALKHKKEDTLNYIVQQLKNEQSEIFDGDDVDEKKDINNDGEKNNIHSMYFETNYNGSNIFHVMFKSECSIKAINILSDVLGANIIHQLLNTRNYLDELPVYNAFLTNSIEILEFILKHFDDPLEKYYLIAKRNKFNKSLLHKTTTNKSKMDKETKLFMAKVIKECLDECDINNLDMTIIKDTFQYTINWNYPPLQNLILQTIAESDHEMLLNRDNILFGQGKSCLNRCLDADDIEMGKMILSKIPNEKFVDYSGSHTNDGSALLHYGVSNGVGTSLIKLILDEFRDRDKSKLFEYLTEIHKPAYRADENAYYKAYEKGNKQYTQLLLSYLDDTQKHVALAAALPNDRDFTWWPKILSTLSSKDAEKQILHKTDSEGATLLKVACSSDFLTTVDWIVNSVKEMDDLMLIQRDNRHKQVGLSHVVYYNEYGEIVGKILQKLTPPYQLQLLTEKDFTGSMVLTSSGYCADVVKSVNKSIGQIMNAIEFKEDDDDTLFHLFKYATTCANSEQNIENVKLILSKTPKHIQSKLFLNMEKDRNWNVLLKTIEESQRKPLFEFFIKYGQSSEVIDLIEILGNKKPNVLQKCCAMGDLDNVKRILNVYDENKENSDEQLIKISNDGSPLSKAIQNGNIDLINFILERIKNDFDKLKVFNAELTKGNIFDYVSEKSTKCKDIIKTAVISILRNIKKTKLKSDLFIPYFHWIVFENDCDSIKQLLNIFKSENNYVLNLLKSCRGKLKRSPLQIACEKQNIDTIKFLLPFVKDDKQKEMLLGMEDKEGNSIFMILCQHSNSECYELILNKLKPNKKLLSQILLMRNADYQTCFELEIEKK
eukprot:147967_1